MSNSQEELATGCLNVLWRFLVNIPLAIVLRGWVVLSYWGWFIIPLGAPSINFWHAMGASGLVSYLTSHDTLSWSTVKLKSAQQKKHGIDEGLGGAFAESAWAVFYTLFFMGFGWLYATMM